MLATTVNPKKERTAAQIAATERMRQKALENKSAAPVIDESPASVNVGSVEQPTTTIELDSLTDQVTEDREEKNHGIIAAPGFVITFWANNQHGYDAMVNPLQGAGVQMFDQNNPRTAYCLNPDRFTVDPKTGHVLWGGDRQVAAVETEEHFRIRHQNIIAARKVLTNKKTRTPSSLTDGFDFDEETHTINKEMMQLTSFPLEADE
jgi:hypothetical protein